MEFFNVVDSNGEHHVVYATPCFADRFSQPTFLAIINDYVKTGYTYSLSDGTRVVRVGDENFETITGIKLRVV